MRNKVIYSLEVMLQPLVLFLLIFSVVLTISCSSDENEKEPDPDTPGYSEITITDIKKIPENVTFDKVKVEITGACWSVIKELSFPYTNGQVIMSLPTTFLPEELQKVDRQDGDMCGCWAVTSSDPEALVASLGDIYAYKGDKKVGRIFLSNWDREGSSAGKAFIYYQYADRPFLLTGSEKSYYYIDFLFNKGWNAYANINPLSENTEGNIRRTTNIPDASELFWCFESYVY